MLFLLLELELLELELLELELELLELELLEFLEFLLFLFSCMDRYLLIFRVDR